MGFEGCIWCAFPPLPPFCETSTLGATRQRGFVIHLGALAVPPEAHDYLCCKLSLEYNLNVINLHWRGAGVSAGETGMDAV